MFKINKFSNEHNERAMSMTSAYQKFNNLEPQFPVFQIELVNSKRFKNLLNINIFTDWTQWADNKNDFRVTKVYDLEPQASIFQIELVNSKRFKLCSTLKKLRMNTMNGLWVWLPRTKSLIIWSHSSLFFKLS